MPFKSKRQQRFMFAAEDRGDMPKGTARRWAHETPNLKKLPEKAKEKKAFAVIARELGQQAALEKRAGLADWLISQGIKTAPFWAPAAAGAYLAGPGYRGEGALVGGLAGGLGRGIGKAMGVKSIEPLAKQVEGKGYEAARAMARRIGSGEAVEGAPAHAKKLLQHWGLGGSVAGGAAGGLAAGRLLGAQNPYGMQPVFPGLGRENPLGVRPQ